MRNYNPSVTSCHLPLHRGGLCLCKFWPPLCKGCGLPAATSKRSLEAPTEAGAETGDHFSGGGVVLCHSEERSDEESNSFFRDSSLRSE